jgi:hypothetical protein
MLFNNLYVGSQDVIRMLNLCYVGYCEIFWNMPIANFL